MFKKLRLWFWNKKKTINELIKISKIIDAHNEKLASQLEELDQDKTYILPMPGANDEEVNYAKHAFNEAARKMRWTMPKIIFTNTVLVEKKSRRVKK